MAKYSAEVIIKIDGNERVVITLEADTIKALKHEIYGIAFIDIDGENIAALEQWKADTL